MPIPEILQGRLRLPVVGAPMFIVSTPRETVEALVNGMAGEYEAARARISNCHAGPTVR
jgi:nitronate monooxygenase